MINVFGEEKFKPVVRFRKQIPGYYISKEGEVYSQYKRELLKLSADYSKRSGRVEALKFTVDVDINLFDDYEYYTRHVKGDKCRPTLRVHKAVMDAWRPIDEYPPEVLKDTWNQIITPDMVGQPRITEEWKQWARDTAYIDHIDDDPKNNHVDNLRWVTPKENSNHRKKKNFKK